MKELILNGTRIVLPKDFSSKFIEANPVITKNGVYTLDINLSLKNKINAVFFAHINRFNTTKTKTIGSAVLIVDNKIRLNGTAVITQVNNNSVTIQLLSGNSELNYICDDTLMMSDLDYGEIEDPITLEIAVDANSKKWPNTNFACARNNIGGVQYNRIYKVYDEQTQTSHWEEENNIQYNVQPYVMYYLTKTIEYLGYTITDNILDGDDLFERLIIFSNKASLNYNDHTPNWTVKKLLEQIEMLGNVIYVIDKKDKTIRIMRSATYYQTAETCYIPDADIEDDYQTDEDENDYGKLNYTKIKFNLDDTEYFKYQSLSDQVFKIADVETFADFDAMFDAYPTNAARQAVNGTLKIFYITESENHYIIKDFGNGVYYFKIINIFKEWNTGNENDSFLQLDIIPVEIIGQYIAYVDAVAQNDNPETNINNPILNGFSTPEKTTVLKVGLQMGLIVIDIYTNPRYEDGVNIAVNDCYKLLPYNQVEALLSSINYQYCLRFNTALGLHARYYSESLSINSSLKWTIRFRWKNEYDVRNYFIFKGRKFFCQQIESDGDKESNDGFVTGYFYESLN